MRTSLIVIAALFASVQAQAEPVAKDSALESYDPEATDKNEAKAEAPPAKIPAFNEPSFNSGMPSSAGLAQRVSNHQLFATGMNGDEDLGEDITMKGDKFHFAQNLAQAEPVVYSTKGYGANGGVEKLSFFDPKIAKAHTSFYSQLRADPEAPQTTTAGGTRLDSWAKYDTKGYGPVEKLSFFDPKIAKAHTTFSLSQAEPVVYETKGYGANGGVEKLSFFDPKIAKAHTSFYSQFASGMNGDEDLGEDITMKGDKFHFAQNLNQLRANPEASQKTTAGGERLESWAKYDTTGYGPVEKLSFFDPKVAKAHTSFYNRKY